MRHLAGMAPRPGSVCAPERVTASSQTLMLPYCGWRLPHGRRSASHVGRERHAKRWRPPSGSKRRPLSRRVL